MWEFEKFPVNTGELVVLILVCVEVSVGDRYGRSVGQKYESLNPCLCGS